MCVCVCVRERSLYNCGKVCLSLLGTWSGSKGEQWDPVSSSVLQVGMPAKHWAIHCLPSRWCSRATLTVFANRIQLGGTAVAMQVWACEGLPCGQCIAQKLDGTLLLLHLVACCGAQSRCMHVLHSASLVDSCRHAARS